MFERLTKRACATVLIAASCAIIAQSGPATQPASISSILESHKTQVAILRRCKASGRWWQQAQTTSGLGNKTLKVFRSVRWDDSVLDESVDFDPEDAGIDAPVNDRESVSRIWYSPTRLVNYVTVPNQAVLNHGEQMASEAPVSSFAEVSSRLQPTEPASYLYSYLLGGPCDFFSVAACGKVTLRPTIAIVDGHACDVIDVEDGSAKFTAWFDRDRGETMLCLDAVNYRDATGATRDYHVDSIDLKKLGDAWLPTALHAHSTSKFNGVEAHVVMQIRLDEFVPLSTADEARDATSPSIPDGTKVVPYSAQGSDGLPRVWKAGKVIVDSGDTQRDLDSRLTTSRPTSAPHPPDPALTEPGAAVHPLSRYLWITGAIAIGAITLAAVGSRLRGRSR